MDMPDDEEMYMSGRVRTNNKSLVLTMKKDIARYYGLEKGDLVNIKIISMVKAQKNNGVEAKGKGDPKVIEKPHRFLKKF